MNSILNEKPELVSTGEGFCVLNTVKYKEKFLYSKYSPDKIITRIINEKEIKPNTLVIIFSPCLWYGLDLLKTKCDSTCEILALEGDKELYNLASSQLNNEINFINSNDKGKIEEFVNELLRTKNIKRAVRIDFSGGVQFNIESYNFIFTQIQNLISQYWKNKITLIQFGKFYAKNILLNLSNLADSLQLEQLSSTISKPILVCGAGESLEQITKEIAEKYFVLAVDASLPYFKATHIRPDAVVAMESQFSTIKAFVGSANLKIPLFCDLVSRPDVPQILNGSIIYFTTKYTSSLFLEELYNSKIIKGFVPPMGSVGLACIYIALKLRKDESVPVYFTGLDFSFTAGKTHARNTSAHLQGLITSYRLRHIENLNYSFREDSIKCTGKNNNKIITNNIMQIYAEQFHLQFINEKNIYDAGKTGLELGFERADLEKITLSENKAAENNFQEIICSTIKNTQDSSDGKKYLEKEKNELLIIKDLLENGEKSKHFDETETLEAQLFNKIKTHDYLYLHFPDSNSITLNKSFFKRIKAELIYFLKQINSALL